MLQHRLYRNIRRVLMDVCGQPIEISFIVSKFAEEQAEPDMPLFKTLAQQQDDNYHPNNRMIIIMYEPSIGERLIVDYKILNRPQKKRIGTIINKAQRSEGNQYIDIYVIRTDYNEFVRIKLGQFIKFKNRHLDHSEVT